MYLQKMKFLTCQIQKLYPKGCGNAIKMTPFCHKMHYNKTMLLNTKIFFEQLKPFALRIRANFYENPTRNKNVSRFNQKLAFFKKIFYEENIF